MNWVDAELVLVSLGAMLSPLTLTWSVLALVLSKRPLYTGLWFYLGALLATVAVGIAAAFVLGNAAASHDESTPKTWVSAVDVIAGILLLVWVFRFVRRPIDPAKEAKMVLLPLAVAIVLLLVAHDWAEHVLGLARDWIERRAVLIAAVLVIVLAASLLRAASPGSRVRTSGSPKIEPWPSRTSRSQSASV